MKRPDIHSTLFEPLEPRIMLSSVVESVNPNQTQDTAAGAYVLSEQPAVSQGLTVDVQNYANVQDYGAVGDGVANDVYAIQAAFDTGLPVYIPRTNAFYKISVGLTYSGHRIVSDGATIKSTGTPVILKISNVDGVYVGDLRLEFPYEQAMTSGSNALTIENCTNFMVERVVGVRGGSIYVYQSANGVVRNSQLLDASYNGFYVRSSTQVVVENSFSEKSVSAFAVEDSTYVKFLNNTGEDAHTGLRIEDSANVLAEGNVFRYCVTGGTAYGPQSASSIFTTDITFKGNTFYYCYKNISIDKNESYVNHVVEYALATKMYVGNVLFENNIVIGNDESTLLTDLSSSSNVVFNPAVGFDAGYVTQDTSGTSYYTMVPYANYVYLNKSGGMPVDWLFYVNFPTAFDASNEDVLTFDFYWGMTYMDPDTMAVNLYAGENRTDFLCQIPLYNPYEYITLPSIAYIPDGVDASVVKCIEFERIGGSGGAPIMTISEIRKGLESKVGYLHSYYHSEPADGAQNVVLDSNVFVDVDYDYVDRKRISAYPMTIIPETTPTTGTTAQRPINPENGWRYYDTDINTPIYWDGNDWIDISTYWLDNEVNSAVHFDGTNFVDLRNDSRVNLDNYTIEGWIKSTGNAAMGYIVKRYDSNAPNGYFMTLWDGNTISANQSVNGNLGLLMVQSAFPQDNELHHVAVSFSYDGVTSTLKLYVDGTLTDTGSVTGAPDYPSEDTAVQCGNGFVGTIDEIKFYTRTLSDSEIAKSYQRYQDKMYSYWRFDEGSGTETYDSSPYGSRGTLSHNVGLLNNMDPVGAWVDGKTGRALSFDGNDDYVNFGNDEWLDATNYTISGWIKPGGSGVADRNIIQRGEIGDPSGYLLMLYSDDNLYGYQSVNGNFYEIMVQTPFPHDNQYHHVALSFSYDGAVSMLKLYLDGQLVDTGTAVGAPDSPFDVWTLGDANNDGVVSAGDYASVQGNFGNTSSNATTGAFITVGTTGADYSDFNAAIAAVTQPNTTIEFLDSGIYDMAGQPSLTAAKYEGLTIKSAEDQKATINFIGAGSYCLLYGRANMTLQNMRIVNNTRDAGWLGDGNAVGMVVNNVEFVNNIPGAYILGASPGMEVSYSTFYGAGTATTSGKGISVYLGATDTVTVDHCSFDNLGTSPIHNGVGAVITVTNSAFGNYNVSSSYRRGIYVAGSLTADYNAFYLTDNLAYQEGSGVLPNGAHTIDAADYAGVFSGSTSAGNWSVPTPLQTAASDGTAIGAWQVPVSQPAVFLLGDANGDGVVSAGDYATVQANFGSTSVSANLICGENYEGAIDEVKFYARTLDAREIADEFDNAGQWVGVFESPLAAVVSETSPLVASVEVTAETYSVLPAEDSVSQQQTPILSSEFWNGHATETPILSLENNSAVALDLPTDPGIIIGNENHIPAPVNGSALFGDTDPVSISLITVGAGNKSAPLPSSIVDDVLNNTLDDWIPL